MKFKRTVAAALFCVMLTTIMPTTVFAADSLPIADSEYESSVNTIEQESGYDEISSVDEITDDDEEPDHDIEVDNGAAAEVENLIDAIGEVMLDSQAAIEAARTAYDSLPEEQKPLVKNISILEEAEKTYEKLLADSLRNGLSDERDADGNWYYYKNGEIDRTYTGVTSNKNGWWYVKDGKVDFTAHTVADRKSVV